MRIRLTKVTPVTYSSVRMEARICEAERLPTGTFRSIDPQQKFCSAVAGASGREYDAAAHAHAARNYLRPEAAPVAASTLPMQAKVSASRKMTGYLLSDLASRSVHLSPLPLHSRCSPTIRALEAALSPSLPSALVHFPSRAADLTTSPVRSVDEREGQPSLVANSQLLGPSRSRRNRSVDQGGLSHRLDHNFARRARRIDLRT